ncbi:ATP-binding protein [Marinobacter sp. S6332]|uniref:hybrid sensor histidine kinase/response regulator n=1 Tax=Marinobacter sp. S6332 TaxID=2926403 RepID=UPI001FF1E7C7|nr:ATP-binding protein [Marinobacter sp. S6332]MCK0163916.1 ATP-binding protein [Marinobacter sp. S6332]
MTKRNWIATCVAIFAAFLLTLSTISQAQTEIYSNPYLDLATQPDGSELIEFMQAISGNNAIQSLNDAQSAVDWIQPEAGTLSATRRHATTWLKTTLHNSSNQALIRWLAIEPWRLNKVHAYFVEPVTGRTLHQTATGLDIPLQNRAVNNGKTIIPVRLNAGQTQQLFLKINSDNLPFISIESWEPVPYSETLTENRIFLAAFFAGILTLLLILAFQLNASLLVTGSWLMVAFIREAEKNGFFTNYLLPSLESYSINLRVTAAMLSTQLFLATSVFILGLNHQRGWRNYLLLTGAAAAAMACLTFIVDGSSIRKLGILCLTGYMITWPFIIPAALKTRPAGLSSILLMLLLSVYWLTTSFLLLGYTFNFYYTALFAPYRLGIETATALVLILIYSWQQKHQIRTAKNALKAQEIESRKSLELTVKQRTEDLRNALETARKASQAKVNFLGQVTHDLRSPLTAILGYAQLQSADAVDARKATQVILDRSIYMKDLIDGLVDYAHGISTASDEPQDIYLIAFIDNLVNHAHIIAGKQNNRFQFKIETDLPTVIRCSSKQLQRILLNLLDNAAKYTQGGEFSLAVAQTSNQQPSLIFRVSDTGCGISADDLKKIYTPFYQSAEDNPGAGLGLSICFELAENLGGNLELKSEPGKGTTATCTIPYATGEERLATPSLAAVHDLLPTFDAKGQKAWVVEDSEPVRELLDDELTAMGFDVEFATTAEAFAQSVSGSAPAIIVSDYQLPGASGDEVLRIARSQWPKVPVILLSATQNSNPRPEKGSPKRFSAYLSKPVDLFELRMTLAELCNLEPEA